MYDWLLSCFQQFHNVFRDSRFNLTRFGVEDFEFLVEGFELFLKVLVAEVLALGDADVATGIERPALGFDFLKGCDFAEAGNVAVGDGIAEDFLPFLLAAVIELQILAAIEADEVGEEFELGVGEIAVSAVELAEYMAGVDEQDCVLTLY